VIGATADHVVGMDAAESRALLDALVLRSTTPDRVYRHTWSVGDTVIWDNRGVMHRAAPYDATSPREMLRTTVLGDEPIQ
jgi:alpha-ketoglutarate-dependent taurine dioxygenase